MKNPDQRMAPKYTTGWDSAIVSMPILTLGFGLAADGAHVDLTEPRCRKSKSDDGWLESDQAKNATWGNTILWEIGGVASAHLVG
jgi:hypothetical protein